jgi:hypothetical protein
VLAVRDSNSKNDISHTKCSFLRAPSGYDFISKLLYILQDIHVKSRIIISRAAFSEKKALFTIKWTEIYGRNYYILSIALYGVETWTLRKVNQKYLEGFEMWCWRRMQKIV